MSTFFNLWPLTTHASHLFYPPKGISLSSKKSGSCQKINSLAYGLFANLIIRIATVIDAIFVELPRYVWSKAACLSSRNPAVLPGGQNLENPGVPNPPPTSLPGKNPSSGKAVDDSHKASPLFPPRPLLRLQCRREKEALIYD